MELGTETPIEQSLRKGMLPYRVRTLSGMYYSKINVAIYPCIYKKNIRLEW